MNNLSRRIFWCKYSFIGPKTKPSTDYLAGSPALWHLWPSFQSHDMSSWLQYCVHSVVLVAVGATVWRYQKEDDRFWMPLRPIPTVMLLPCQLKWIWQCWRLFQTSNLMTSHRSNYHKISITVSNSSSLGNHWEIRITRTKTATRSVVMSQLINTYRGNPLRD